MARRLLEITVVLAALALWAMAQPAEEQVSVFPTRMDGDCVSEAQRVLGREGIALSASDDGSFLMVSPKDRARAQVALVLAGLPRHRIQIRDDWGCDGASIELLRQRAARAEVAIAQAVSVFPGVGGARVKVKIPEEMGFAENPKPNRVQVWVQLESRLQSTQIDALTRLALANHYDIRHPIKVEIYDLSANLLGSAQRGYSTGPERAWEKF